MLKEIDVYKTISGICVSVHVSMRCREFNSPCSIVHTSPKCSVVHTAQVEFKSIANANFKAIVSSDEECIKLWWSSSSITFLEVHSINEGDRLRDQHGLSMSYCLEHSYVWPSMCTKNAVSNQIYPLQ
jgi:hypothetical protein